MKKITLIILIICAFMVSFCSTGSKGSSGKNTNLTVTFPTEEELAAINESNHVALDGERIEIPAIIEPKPDEDPLDGSDNDGDGLYDEGHGSCECFAKLQGDFDCNGIVNQQDGNMILLVAYNATIFNGPSDCTDLDGNRQVDMSDLISFLGWLKDKDNSMAMR